MVNKSLGVSKECQERDTREKVIELEEYECSIMEVRGREGFRKKVVNRVK